MGWRCQHVVFLRASLRKKIDNGRLAALTCEVEGMLAVGARRLDVGTAFEERANHIDGSAIGTRSQHEDRAPLPIGSVWVRPIVEEQLDPACIAARRRRQQHGRAQE